MSAANRRARRAAPRGFSLFEMIIVAALLLILGSLVIAVLIPSFRTTAAIQERVSMQQKAVMVFRRLANDIQDTPPAAISIGPSAIAGQPLKEFTPEAAQRFETRLWGYNVVGDKLRRVEWKSPGPPSLSVAVGGDSPVRLPQSDLAKLATMNPPSALTLTGDVSSFAVTHAGSGTSVSGPIAVELLLLATGSDPAQVRMRRVFSPRLGE